MFIGVPNEIMDMTRSLEMVERYRLIYRTMVFGHRKCFEMYQEGIGSPKGVPGTPRQVMGLMGQRRGQTRPQGGWCAPSLVWPDLGKEKGEG